MLGASLGRSTCKFYPLAHWRGLMGIDKRASRLHRYAIVSFQCAKNFKCFKNGNLAPYSLTFHSTCVQFRPMSLVTIVAASFKRSWEASSPLARWRAASPYHSQLRRPVANEGIIRPLQSSRDRRFAAVSLSSLKLFAPPTSTQTGVAAKRAGCKANHCVDSVVGPYSKRKRYPCCFENI